MNVEVDVRELVLTGVGAPDPAALGDAVRVRLTRLLAERGLPSASPPPGPLPAPPGTDLPQALAEAIWAQLGRPACREVDR
ncbi:hypothetical protein AB0I85_25850 [Micromonospora echinofusca]|uniref:hypothetical protein n=1 Tax=Micromonospora echinofusca TaxID=47858 RepID=UPI000C70AA20|nr:hypothetical protein [Micromonospora sp. MSM11]MCL7456202.1 hypothetical protein [Micromonospora sp. MSM11]